MGQLITGLVLGNSTFSVPIQQKKKKKHSQSLPGPGFTFSGIMGSVPGVVGPVPGGGIVGIMEGSVPGVVGSVPGLVGTGPGLVVTDEVLGTFFGNVPKLILLKLGPGFTLSAFSVG